jgi:hypothetical protein
MDVTIRTATLEDGPALDALDALDGAFAALGRALFLRQRTRVGVKEPVKVTYAPTHTVPHWFSGATTPARWFDL